MLEVNAVGNREGAGLSCGEAVAGRRGGEPALFTLCHKVDVWS